MPKYHKFLVIVHSYYGLVIISDAEWICRGHLFLFSIKLDMGFSILNA